MPAKRLSWRFAGGPIMGLWPLKVGHGSSLPPSTLKTNVVSLIPFHKTFWIRTWIMSVDSLISIEPVHTHCMHARIQNILSEGVVREDRNATKNGPPSAHQRNAIVDNGPPLNAGLVALIRINIARKPYIFVIFQGGPDPLPPSGSAHGMHLKEGTCLKCPFQRTQSRTRL